MAEMVVWVSEPSVVCARVKSLLDRRGYEYRAVQVSTDEDRARMLEETGMQTCPLVTVGGEIVGGLSETYDADRSGLLREMVAAG